LIHYLRSLHNIPSQSKWSSLDQKQAFGWTHPSDPIDMAEEDDGASMLPNDFWLDKKFQCNKFEGNESILTNNEEDIECAKIKVEKERVDRSFCLVK